MLREARRAGTHSIGPRSVGTSAASRRSGNGSEFIAEAVQKWLHDLHVKPLFIEPGSLFEENGYVESFNSRLRDELLNGEIFETLLEAKVIIEDWRKDYNCFRPHSSLGYRPPAPEAFEVPKSLAAAAC